MFSRSDLKNGDIIDDFVSYLDIDRARLVTPPRLNTNAPAFVLKFLLHEFSALKAVGVPANSVLGTRIRNRARQLFSGEGLLPSRPEVAAFMAQFEAANEQMRQDWFPQRRVMFDIDYEKYPPEPQPMTLTPDEICRIFTEILAAELAVTQ